MKLSTRLISVMFVLVLGLMLAACGAAAPADSVVPEQEPVATEAEAEAMPESSEAEAVTDSEAPAEETAPTAEPVAVVAGGVSFKNDILPIFDRSCVRCHGGNRIEAELDLRSYAALMSGSENGAVILPGDAEGSELIAQVESGEMPRRAPKLEAEKIQLLIDWVNQGAQDN